MKISRVLLTVFAIICGTALARANPPAAHVDIPAQPLATALRQFADQTGLELAVETSITTGKIRLRSREFSPARTRWKSYFRVRDSLIDSWIAALSRLWQPRKHRRLNSPSGDVQQISDTHPNLQLAQINSSQPTSGSSGTSNSSAHMPMGNNGPEANQQRPTVTRSRRSR